jgi:hypothetical protein
MLLRAEVLRQVTAASQREHSADVDRNCALGLKWCDFIDGIGDIGRGET